MLGGLALNLAIGVGASVLSSIVNPQKKTPKTTLNTSRGFSFEMAVGESAPLSAVFGLGRATGKMIYLNEFGPNNDFLQMLVEVGIGEHDGMHAFLIDEKPVTFAGSNADPRGRSVVEFTVGGEPYMWVKYYTGAPGQAADPELVAQSNPAGRWTSAHKMTGRAYYIITFRFQTDLYAGGTLPLSGSVWRGLKMHDWRVPGAVWGDQSTYVFSKNPAVIRYNFRRGIYVNGVKVLGQGFSPYANDLAGYTAAANVCDESIFDPVSGKTFARYEYGREIGDDEEKLAVLSELDDSYCGSSFKRGGADVPLPAQQLISVMTLTDNDRIAGNPVSTNRKGVVSAKRTMFHGQFVSEESGWSLAPFTPRINTTLESVLGGRRSIAVDQPYEHMQERAQARAEIGLRRQFYPATRVETFTPKALALEPGDPITRNSEWGPMLMVVEKVEPLENKLGATVTMTQWDNAIVPASGDSFVVLPDGPGAGPANPNRTIAVSGFNVVAYQRLGGGAVHPFGRATWTQITDPNVDQVMIRVWPADGDPADHEDFFADSKLTSAKLVGPLQPLTEYAYKAIPIRSDARLCVFTNVGTFTTGEELTPAEVADGSIGPGKLAQELLNERGYLVGEGAGTLEERIADLLAKQAQADAAALTDQTTNFMKSSVLKAQNGKAMAVVSRVERVVAEEQRALAELTEEVAVDIANLNAGGLFQITAEVEPGGAQAQLLMKVRAALADAFSAEAALRLTAEATGDGDTIAYVDMLADRFRFVTTAGAVISIPFEIDGGQVFITKATIRDLDATNINVNALTATVGFFNNLVATWAQIQSAVVGNFVATSANIGTAAVSTIKIAAGGVTTLYAGANPSSVTLNFLNTYETVVSLTVTVTEGAVFLLGSGNLVISHSLNVSTGRLSLFRNGTQIGSSRVQTPGNLNQGFTVFASDAPAPGTHVYELKAQVEVGSTGSVSAGGGMMVFNNKR